MGRYRYLTSVSVFGISVGIFFKSVRYSVSVFQNIAISVRYFGISAGPLQGSQISLVTMLVHRLFVHASSVIRHLSVLDL